MSVDLLLDSQIRLWVFLPIILLTCLIEVFRHYLILLVKDDVTLTLNEIKYQQMKKRIAKLQENFMYIPNQAFETRKQAFKAESEFLKQKQKMSQTKMEHPFVLSQQTKFFNTMKGQSSNHLPMVLAGTWVSYSFSGFICTKVPFPLTFSFKSMLQRNIDLNCLDPSWVSSCSWYFLNVFGFRNFLAMFFENSDDWESCKIDCLGEEMQFCFKEDINSLDMITHMNSISNE